MPIINEILEWHFRPSHLKFTAEHLFTSTTKTRMSEFSVSLERLVERLPDGGNMPDGKSIEEMYYYFIENYNSLFFSMTKRDVRLLIWALDYQPIEGERILFSNKLNSAFYFINKNWRNSYIIGLWHVLLKNWSELQSNKTSRELFLNFLKDRCKSYDGDRSSILKISQNIDFFLTTDSPHNYASLLHDTLLHDKKIVLSDANKLFDHKERILSYDYFSAVAKEYIYITWNNNINMDTTFVKGVYHFLEKHNSKKTTLLICAQIINEKVFNNNIDIVKNETIKLIGDPAVYYLWRNVELADNEQEEVEQARKKLNILLNKEFIEVFFKILIQDDRREKYWLGFIDKIEIIFVGNRANYLELKKIESISKLVDNRYKITSSSQSTCALIMYSKGYVFVEFSDTGALYIYKEESFINRVNLNAVGSIQDLKMWSTTKSAVSNSYYGGLDINIEGRITHQGR